MLFKEKKSLKRDEVVSLDVINYKEWLAQALFLVVLFFLFFFDKDSPSIKISEVVFFVNYTIIGLVISYFLFPTFFYKKKYLQFILALSIVLAYAYVMEEFVLEKIFFSDERGKYISNVFFTLLEIIPLLLTMVSFKLIWEANKKQQQVESLHSAVKESELRFLKSQINPHFLFNNLNNLYAYAIEKSPRTPSIILELSTVLRYMLYDCKEDFVPLKAEVEHLKHFTALSELQIEDRGTVKFHSVIANNRFEIAPLVLSMFTENAFKHSTVSQTEAILIDININVSESGLFHFVCRNSYSENSNQQSLSNGIGLDNVKKRLALLYPKKHELRITDTNNLYHVDLEIQLKSK